MSRDFVSASSQYINFPTTANLLDGATSCSISFILTADDFSSEHKVVCDWGNAGGVDDDSFIVSLNTDGKLLFAVRDLTNVNEIWGRVLQSAISTGVEYQVVMTWVATNTFLIYLNGSSVAHDNLASGSVNSINDSVNNLRIGAANDGGYFDGRISEVAIWKNRVLTAAEAAELGKRFSPLFLANNLVFYAPLIGNSPETDLKSGLAGTVTNGASKASHPRIVYPKA